MPHHPVSRFLSLLTLALLVLEVTVAVGSWVVCVTVGSTAVRPMLTAGGTRWFVGGFARMLCSEVLIWVVLAAMAWGAARGSGIAEAIRAALRRGLPQRRDGDVTAAFAERAALNIALTVALTLTAAYLFLSIAPHAVLLGATGKLAGSAAAHGLIPAATLTVTATAATFGFCSSRFRTFHDIFAAMAGGVRKAAPLVVLYVFVMTLLRTVQYVLG